MSDCITYNQLAFAMVAMAFVSFAVGGLIFRQRGYWQGWSEGYAKGAFAAAAITATKPRVSR